MKKKLLILLPLIFLTLSACNKQKPTSESEEKSESLTSSEVSAPEEESPIESVESFADSEESETHPFEPEESESEESLISSEESTIESEEESVIPSEEESVPPQESEEESIFESEEESILPSEAESQEESIPVEESSAEEVSESIVESETEIVSEEESEIESETEIYTDSSESGEESLLPSEEESIAESEEESEIISEEESESEQPVYEKGLEGDPIRTDAVAQDYYKNISSTATGDSLASALYTLVNKNRCTTGYGSLWSYYPYCDADPDNPSSNKVIAFYRGTPSDSGSMNKEHVWPNSRGGNLVEGDPHMTRPTLTSDNSSRGNSFYVEGRCSTQDGWDPKEDGLNENFRGDSARIIFYAAIAKYGELTLVDKTNDTTSNYTMGKLYDLIKWNFEYPISKYEILRNEVLSGERSVKGSNYHFNRNPFIDDRTLPCKIWGNTNSNISALCQMHMQRKAPTQIHLNKTSLTLGLEEQYKLEVESVSPADAFTGVTWSTSDDSVVTVDDIGNIKAIDQGVATIIATSEVDKKITATCTVTVKAEDVALTKITVTSSLPLKVGSTGKIDVAYTPSNVYPRPTLSFSIDDDSVATVDNNGVVTGVSEGSAVVTVEAKQNDITRYGSCDVTVVNNTTFKKVTSNQTNWEGQYLIVNESNSKAFDSSASSIDSSANAISVSISNNEIQMTDKLLAALVVVEKSGNNYIMKTSTGLTISNSSKNIITTAGGTTTTTFTMSGTNVNIASGSDYLIKYNSSASMFRYYNTSTMQNVQMYKLV
ncbi:MAG: Ig-like domain-containing protein [Bacilli bacterium]|nr:Ig-like domain-containing protein [Bacilli bacterium]